VNLMLAKIIAAVIAAGAGAIWLWQNRGAVAKVEAAAVEAVKTAVKKGVHYNAAIDAALKKWAASYALDLNDVRALVMSESGFGQWLENPLDPSYGIGHFLISTAKDWLFKIEGIKYSDAQVKHILLTDTDRAAHLVCAYLNDLKKSTGSMEGAVQAYKCGLGLYLKGHRRYDLLTIWAGYRKAYAELYQ